MPSSALKKKKQTDRELRNKMRWGHGADCVSRMRCARYCSGSPLPPAILPPSISYPFLLFFFFFNDTATTEIYTLSLHDALPISEMLRQFQNRPRNRVISFLLREYDRIAHFQQRKRKCQQRPGYQICQNQRNR